MLSFCFYKFPDDFFFTCFNLSLKFALRKLFKYVQRHSRSYFSSWVRELGCGIQFIKEIIGHNTYLYNMWLVWSIILLVCDTQEIKNLLSLDKTMPWNAICTEWGFLAWEYQRQEFRNYFPLKAVFRFLKESRQRIQIFPLFPHNIVPTSIVIFKVNENTVLVQGTF